MPENRDLNSEYSFLLAKISDLERLYKYNPNHPLLRDFYGRVYHLSAEDWLSLGYWFPQRGDFSELVVELELANYNKSSTVVSLRLNRTDHSSPYIPDVFDFLK